MFASTTSTLQLFSLNKGSIEPKYLYKPSHTSNNLIKHISWSYDNLYLAILPENECVQILCTENPSNIALVHKIEAIRNVTTLGFHPRTKKCLALGTSKGEVILYDTIGRSITKKLGQLEGAISSLEFNGEDQLLAAYGHDVAFFNLGTEKDKFVLKGLGSACTVLKGLRSTIVLGYANGEVKIWDVILRREVIRYHWHSKEITDVVHSPKHQLFVTVGLDNKMCLIDCNSNQCIFTKLLHDKITSLDISQDEEYLVAGLRDGSLYVYSTQAHLRPNILPKLLSEPVKKIRFTHKFIPESPPSSQQSNLEVLFENLNQFTEEDPNVDEGVSAFDSEEWSTQAQSSELYESKMVSMINHHFEEVEKKMEAHWTGLEELLKKEMDRLFEVASKWECFDLVEPGELKQRIEQINEFAKVARKKSM